MLLMTMQLYLPLEYLSLNKRLKRLQQPQCLLQRNPPRYHQQQLIVPSQLCFGGRLQQTTCIILGDSPTMCLLWCKDTTALASSSIQEVSEILSDDDDMSDLELPLLPKEPKHKIGKNLSSFPPPSPPVYPTQLQLYSKVPQREDLTYKAQATFYNALFMVVVWLVGALFY